MANLPQETIRILLVDDHALFRESLVRLLESEEGFGRVAQCSTRREALEILENATIDIILLDVDLGPEKGGDLIDDLQTIGYKGKTLLVTAGVNEADVPSFIRKGIAGVFMKHNSPALLIQGIRETMQGKVWFDQDLLRCALEDAARDPGDARPKLTPREKMVLGLVFQGLTNKEIADRTKISVSLVKACLQNLFSKTGVRTRSQLVRVALEQYKEEL
jgi:two-component system, NarL family, nitrate/nitrite response regulator NarL